MNEAAAEAAVAAALDNFAAYPVLGRVIACPPMDDLIAIQVPAEGTGFGMMVWLSWPAAWDIAGRVLCDAPAALSTDQVLAVALELAEEICTRYMLENDQGSLVQVTRPMLVPPNAGGQPPKGVAFRLEVGNLIVNWIPMDAVVEAAGDYPEGITQLLHSIQ